MQPDIHEGRGNFADLPSPRGNLAQDASFIDGFHKVDPWPVVHDGIFGTVVTGELRNREHTRKSHRRPQPEKRDRQNRCGYEQNARGQISISWPGAWAYFRRDAGAPAFLGFGRFSVVLQRSDETIAAARQGFYEAGAFGGIAERLANLVNGCVQIVLNVDAGVWP